MTLSLQSIARATGGRVVRDHVVTAYPGKKKSDTSVSLYVNDDDIGLHVHRDDVDLIALKDYFQQIIGLPAWQPKRRTP